MQDFEALALLHDRGRRGLYEYVVAQGREVGRNEAAAALAMPRTLAAFHLDRLADAGLLEVTYRRLGGRTGPGAGRPAKLYRGSNVERSVSLPPRDYVGAATILAEAIERGGAEVALYDAARARGESAGRTLAPPASGGDDTRAPTLESRLAMLERHLAERGYAPYRDDGVVRLRNCPFHQLAETFPVVACGMNLALLEGVVRGSGLGDRVAARMEPRPGECCVVIDARAATRPI